MTTGSGHLGTWVLKSDSAQWDLIEQKGVMLQDGIHCERAMDEPVFALDRVVLSPNRFFRPHRHENLHVLFVHRGSGFYYQDGDVAHLGRNDVVKVDSNTVHCLGAGRNGISAVVLSFPKSSLVSEQRGIEISSREASALIDGVVCCSDPSCRHLKHTLDGLRQLIGGI